MTAHWYSKVISFAMMLSAWACVGATSSLAQNRDGSIIAYFGVFGQGQFTNIDATQIPITPAGPTFSDKVSTNFTGLGLSIGADWRPGPYVLGLVGDFSVNGGQVGFANAKFTSAYLSTIRGRFGYRVLPDWMFYGTLGVAALGTETRIDSSGNKSFKTSPGFVYGLGLEREFRDWVITGEYLRSDFGRYETSVASGGGLFGGGTNTGFSTAYDVNVFRLGFKLKVGHDFYHDDVAERIRR
jgi:opacity protein-like surface antigen